MNRRQFLGGAAGVTLAACVRSTVERGVAATYGALGSVDGAGVKLSRLLGQPAIRHLDPFVLLDRFHSRNPEDYLAGFPDHPHRGFETVSIMLDGHMVHRDSRGNHGDILGGGAQWMTAGRGIVHSEMPRATELLSGFQLWVNLPAREKMRAPEYQDLQPGQLAHGFGYTVIAGEIDGLRGPVRERPTEPLLFHVVMDDDRPRTVAIAATHNAFLYVFDGAIQIRDTRLEAGSFAILTPGNRLTMRAEQRSGVLCAAGRPLHEPIVQRGPFVMNTEEEIRRAWDDYRSGTLAG